MSYLISIPDYSELRTFYRDCSQNKEIISSELFTVMGLNRTDITILRSYSVAVIRCPILLQVFIDIGSKGLSDEFIFCT